MTERIEDVPAQVFEDESELHREVYARNVLEVNDALRQAMEEIEAALEAGH